MFQRTQGKNRGQGRVGRVLVVALLFQKLEGLLRSQMVLVGELADEVVVVLVELFGGSFIVAVPFVELLFVAPRFDYF